MNTRRDLCDSDGSTIIPDLPAAQSDVLCAIRQNNMSSGPTPSKSYNTWENGVLGERVMVWVMSLQIKQKISGFSEDSRSSEILPSLSFMRWDH